MQDYLHLIFILENYLHWEILYIGNFLDGKIS
jgi:hypothetical protein